MIFKLFVSLFLFILSFFLFSSFALAFPSEEIFNIDPGYDFFSRDKILASLIKITNKIYFFAEKDWWENLTEVEKLNFENSIYNVSVEFEREIYPKLTSTFGKEPNPGIDGDDKIYVVFHRMKKDIAGYTRNCDIYLKIQCLNSNQKEIIFFSAKFFSEKDLKIYLAHEFLHLIQLNQKELLRGKQEDIWLAELMAEYTSTFLGYDEEFKGSNLENRVREFLSNPNNSLIEWENKSQDYAISNIFGQYLVENYGLKILTDALQSEKTGINAIEFALNKNNHSVNFSQIFKDWLIAVLINDCSLGEKYCFKNKNLSNLKITPDIHLLPTNGESSFNFNVSIKPFTPKWHKIIGGYGNLELEFNVKNGLFDTSLLVCDKFNVCKIENLNFEQNQTGKIFLEDFSKNYSSLTLILFSKSQFSNPSNLPSDHYSLTINFRQKPISQNLPRENNNSTTTLTSRPSIPSQNINCRKIENNLKFGMKSFEVRCLQEFLKAQGPEIYPEGLITGNFLTLTKKAVIRFQEKYKDEILKPFGLERGTGFVGPLTRLKINHLLSQLNS